MPSAMRLTTGRAPTMAVGRALASISGTYRAFGSPEMGADKLVAKSVEPASVW